MKDKTTSMAAACRLICDKQTIAIGGMTIYRRPVSFVRALIQQDNPPRNLTLLAFTAGIGCDMLVGAKLISHVRTCYFGLETFGLAPMFTKAAAENLLTIIEESEASIANGLRASMAGVGFMPSRAWVGTDLLQIRPDVKTIIDPYSNQTLVAFPAIECDVAIIHALEADRYGNCILGGNLAVDLELTTVAKQVIITAEEISERLTGPIDIHGAPVTAVVHSPGGARPTSCYPNYPIDGKEILDYITACNSDEFDEYIKGHARHI